MTPANIRQKRYIEGLKAKGKCIRCRDDVDKGSVMCPFCLTESRHRMRERGGFKAWHEGGRGRPPK